MHVVLLREDLVEVLLIRKDGQFLEAIQFVRCQSLRRFWLRASSGISKTADVRGNRPTVTFVSDVLAELPLLGADGQESTLSLLLMRPGLPRLAFCSR